MPDVAKGLVRHFIETRTRSGRCKNNFCQLFYEKLRAKARRTMLQLASKTAIITGAGSGIGRAAALKLAKLGATVLAVDLNSEAAEETVKMLGKDCPTDGIAGPSVMQRHVYKSADVSKKEDVQAVFDFAVANCEHPINVLVNSAGITRDEFLLRLDEDQWDSVMNVNLKSVFLMSQAFARHAIAEQKDKPTSQDGVIQTASIVNISSIIGKCGNLGQANYAASKAGVIGFTKSAAKELGGKYPPEADFYLFVFQPGFISTPMANAVPQKVMNMIIPQIPLRRVGYAEDVASAIAFLAGDESSYITGAVIEVTGGLYM